MRDLVGLAPYFLVSFVLLAAAGFFRVAAQRAEMMATQSMRAMEAVRATGMLAMQWSLEVGKVRSEINSNFDVLADFAGRMDHQIRIIRDSQSAMPAPPAGVNGTLDDYVQRLKAREERIERFKSGFAIVRNSRRFVPREGAVLAEAARDGGYGKVEAATRQILERTQSFLKQPTDVQFRRMEQAMSTLAESAAGTTLHTQAEMLNKHVRTLLRHHGPMERRFQDVMDSALEDRAERVIGLLDADYRQSREKRRYFNHGFRVSLGLAVFCWGTALVVRCAGRRRQRKAAARAQEAVLAEESSSLRDMGAAPAATGGSPAPAELWEYPEKKDAVEEIPEAVSISSDVRKDLLVDALKANVQNSLRKVMGIDGAIGVALVDINDGLTLAAAGGGKTLDIETAGAGNLSVIRAEMKVIEQLGTGDRIEDILITLGRQYHLIRPLDQDSADLLLFVVLDRERGNLGMARHQLKGIETNLCAIPGA